METMASPMPSRSPRMARLAPDNRRTYFGQMGDIMSDPKSFKKEAKENTVTTVLLLTALLPWLRIAECSKTARCAIKCVEQRTPFSGLRLYRGHV